MAKFKVLLVDDEVELLDTLIERLELRDIEATGVASGAEALKQVREGGYDVAVLDVKLPGEDGVSVMKQLKEIEPQLPVLLLTGHMSKETSDAGLKAGAIDYVIKPIQIDDLIEKLEAAIAIYAHRD